MRRKCHRMGKLQSIWSPAIICAMGECRTSRRWVERYPWRCVDWDHLLTRPDNAFWFELNDPMTYARINEWVFSYDGRYNTGWIIGLQWRFTVRRTLWRSGKMTFRDLTELQWQSRNAAHTSSIIHTVEKNVWKHPDHSRTWIAAGGGTWSEMDCAMIWITFRSG